MDSARRAQNSETTSSSNHVTGKLTPRSSPSHSSASIEEYQAAKSQNSILSGDFPLISSGIARLTKGHRGYTEISTVDLQEKHNRPRSRSPAKIDVEQMEIIDDDLERSADSQDTDVSFSQYYADATSRAAAITSEVQRNQGNSSTLSAVLNFTNAIIGAGVIGMPFALLESGFWIGIFMTIAVAVIVGKF